jgi:translation initiation factor 3 subunit L
MYALLAISLSFYPHPKLVEENVNNQLLEKYAKKMLCMQHNDEAMFDELFSYACPKFITPTPPQLHPTIMSPLSTLTKYGVLVNHVLNHKFFHHV